MTFGTLNNLNSLGGLGTQKSSVSSFSPSQIPGLSLWFDATRNVYSDAGVTPAVNGGVVQQWNDQSASAKNATGLGTQRPTYNTNIQNGLPGITFDGITNVLTTPIMTLGQPITIFAVMNQKTWVSQNGLFDGIALDNMLLYQNSASPQLRMYGTGSGSNVNFSGLGVNTFGIMNISFNGTSSYYRLNNAAKVTQTTNITGTPNGLVLGRESGFQFGNVIYSEFIVYNVNLSDSDCALVNRYLGSKWAITVT